MSIVRVGTTKKYADGWDAIFGKKAATKKVDAEKRDGEPKATKKTAGRSKK